MVPKLLLGLSGLLIVITTIPLSVIALDAPSSPPAMPTMADSIGQAKIDLSQPSQFRARDGVRLRYYLYPGEPDKIVVLVHGSAGPAGSMHALANWLCAAGFTVYVPDIRGHGESSRRGDIDYIGQIDDDLVDFVAQLGPAKSGEVRTLVGFSAGAGFSIRFAGGPNGLLFDRYLLLAPILPGAPTWRPNAGGWVNIALPRLVTIAWLDRLGIHWFDGLPVISYAVPPQMSQVMTASYSYRLAMNFGAGPVYQAYLKHIRRPAAVLVGDADEQVIAEQFAPLFRSLGVNIPVTVVPNMTHADMIRRPEAFQAVGRAISPQD